MQGKILTFDCYGTLIDWETGIWEAFAPLLERNDAALKRAELLGIFSRAESSQQALTPSMLYPEVLELVHRAVADALDLTSTKDLDVAFGASVGAWPAFADSHDALMDLSSRNKLVILSNVDRDGFAASQARLDVEFDAVYTAQDVGSYKPDPANFAYMLHHLASDFDAEPGDVVHVAQSLFHDHGPAIELGLETVWIDRQRLSEGGDWGATAELEVMPEPDHLFFTMADFAASGLV